MSNANWYEVLGVAPGATQQEIKNAYRREASDWHPDHHTGERGKMAATAQFKLIQEAYRTLRDPETRQRYDATLEAECGSDAIDGCDGFDLQHMSAVARHLAEHGLDESGIVESLVSRGCPRDLAVRLAVQATQAASQRPSRSPASAPPKSEAASTASTRASAAAGSGSSSEGRTHNQAANQEQPPNTSFQQRAHSPAYKPAPEKDKSGGGLFPLWLACTWWLAHEVSGSHGIFSESWGSGLGVLIAAGSITLASIAIGWVIAWVCRAGGSGRRWTAGLLCLSLTAFLHFGSIIQRTHADPGGVTMTPAAATQSMASRTDQNMSLAAPASARASYDRYVAQIEAMYPFLNVDSPQFDQRASDWVVGRMRVHASATPGILPEQALRMAIDDLVANQRKTVAQALPQKSMDSQVSRGGGGSPQSRARQTSDEAFRAYKAGEALCQSFPLGCVHDQQR